MNQNTVLALDAHTIPLQGSHLIEASAGTGKTFNITRIYLRLLLERKLKVQNLLVVTFTKAATEELKGRIDAELRDTLAQWGQRDLTDVFYQHLESVVPLEDANVILRTAIGDLDEAAIFTIHGFCKRVLSQNAFESGLPFDIDMEVDSYELKLDAVRDWFRQLETNPEAYLGLSQYYSTPEVFTDTFRSILGKELTLEGNNPAKIVEDFNRKKELACQQLENNADRVFSILINNHKDKINRADEYSELIQWLTSSELMEMPKSAASVFDGKRYSRKPDDIKVELNALFDPLKTLKKQSQNIESDIERARIDQLVCHALPVINQTINDRKQHSAMMDFDDLVTSLMQSLEGESGQALAQHLVTQYPVALVDEFQDTDPHQYAIFDTIYNSPKQSPSSSSALYMIGDPKQAIYGFRGGDVFAYLSAREKADSQWYMDTNWRSSSAIIEGYNRLFYGRPSSLDEIDEELPQTTHVFKYGIGYTPVKSAGISDSSPLSTIFTNPLRYIYFPIDENYGKKANNQQFRAVIADWCANEIYTLLTSKSSGALAHIKERDIAILVRDRTEAEEMQAALTRYGCASVYLSNRDNVFKSAEASDLLMVLMGILFAEDDRMLIAALSTSLCGFDSLQLLRLQEDELFWEDQRTWFLELRAHWERKGLMPTLFKLVHDRYKPEPHRYERALTNTLHLLELTQGASQKYRQPFELVNWLREKIDNPTTESASELRLESDDNLIQIVTLHGSKGLEYPVVFIPFATRTKGGGNKKPSYYTYHDETTKQPKTFIGYDETVVHLTERERAAEDIRLLYVAITRAKHVCYIGATPFADVYRSPLGLMLGMAKEDDLLGAITNIVNDTPSSAEIVNTAHTTDHKPHTTEHKPHTTEHTPQETVSNTQTTNHVAIEVAANPTIQRMTRRIEDDWWVGSFSALTRNLNHGVMAEPDRDIEDTDNKQETAQPLALRFTLKKGAAAGNLLHDTLETVDFQSPEWKECLRKPLIRFGKIEEEVEQELIAWLNECVTAELTKDLSLSTLSINKTLREVEFYFPVQDTTRQELAGLLQSHRQTQPFPHLPDGAHLKGMMHGFIDLVFEWQGKYYIADYKSTHLGNDFEHYDYVSLKQNIQDNFYDLQYLIYSLALHRFLAQRIEEYTPETHFGGVYYLYLRGMMGDNHTGVYFSDIEPHLLSRLDTLFGGSHE